MHKGRQKEFTNVPMFFRKLLKNIGTLLRQMPNIFFKNGLDFESFSFP